jgi:hypothetical protein
LRQSLLCLGRGLTLTSMFFYPLLTSLHDSPFYFQWKRQNTYELILVLCVASIGLAIVLWGAEALVTLPVRAPIMALVLMPPLASFVIHLIRLSGFGTIWSNPGMVLIAMRALGFGIAIIVVLVIVIVSSKYPKYAISAIDTIYLIMCPLTIVMIWAIIGVAPLNVNDALFRQNDVRSLIKESVAKNERRVLIVLFDEMSYEYLYSEDSVHSRYPHLFQFSAEADNYHRATAPGEKTTESMIGYITGRRDLQIDVDPQSIDQIGVRERDGHLAHMPLDANNIFARARQLGMQTVLVGPLFPYCEMLRDWLDSCRSYSIYNYAGVNSGFSILNPIMTNIILWPRQYPTGIFKAMVYSRWQEQLIEQTVQYALEAIVKEGSIFAMVHLYIPHLPFTFNRDGYYRNPNPFLENRENYIMQLEYADVVFGRLMTALKARGLYDSASIVVLSDHNYRIMYPERKSRIPLIVKKPTQKNRRDVFEPVRGEDVIGRMVRE